MHSTMKEVANHLCQVAAARPEADYWAEVWQLVEHLPLYGTGDNYCFEIRRFDELADPPARLFALPAADFEDRWESIAFAQSALEGMGADDSLANFSGTLLAARIEIVKSRVFCVAHHIYWATRAAVEPDYVASVHRWLSTIEDQRLSYADDEYYLLVTEPFGTLNRGSANWLSQWLQYRYDDKGCPVRIKPRVSGEEFDPDTPVIEVDRSIVLAAAAFAWHDYSLIQDLGAMRATQLASTAGLALFLALQSSADDDPPGKDPSSWGRKGGLERHRHTRALKDWALAEVDRMQGSDKDISRLLAQRLPQRFVDASEDPARLIYDAIRAKRAEVRGRRAR